MLLALAAAGLTAAVFDRPTDVLYLKSGQRVPEAVVQIAADGSVTTQEADRRHTRRLGDLERIAFAPRPVELAEGAGLHRVSLVGGLRLSGRFLSLDDRTLLLAAADGSPIRVDRAAVTALQERSGGAALVKEDFEHGLERWNVSAGASLTDQVRRSGRWALKLTADRPVRVEHRLSHPLPAGEVRLAFYDSGRVERGMQFFCELAFGTGPPVQMVRILLGWEGASYGLKTDPPLAVAVQALGRQEGWRWLAVRLEDQGFLVSVDEAVLAKGPAPDGPLTHLRLGTDRARREGPEPDEPLAGYVDDLAVIRRTGGVLPRPEDPHLDELVLADGDQLWGQLKAVTREGVTLAGPYGEARLAWSQVQAVRLRRLPLEARRLSGWLVRVECQDEDRMEGVLEGLDERGLRLQTAAAGRLHFSRDRLRRLVPLFRGIRQEIDNAYHHLGDEIDDDLDVPEPEGTRYEVGFDLAEVPAEGRLVLALTVVEMVSAGPEGPYAERLKAGELCTYLELNGRRVARLNDHVPDSSDQAVRVRVPIDRQALRRGRNQVVISTVPTGNTIRQHDDFGFWGLALEVEQEAGAAASAPR